MPDRRVFLSLVGGAVAAATRFGDVAAQADPQPLLEFHQEWSISDDAMRWIRNLKPSRRVFGVEMGDQGGFKTFQVESGDLIWEQETAKLSAWRPISDTKSLFGWQLPNSSRLALLNPETNHRDWERTFPTGYLDVFYVEDGRALTGYAGGLAQIEIASGRSIWETAWDCPGYNMDVSIDSGILWAAWQGDDLKLIVSALNLANGTELWRSQTDLTSYHAFPSIKATSKDSVVVAQLSGTLDPAFESLTKLSFTNVESDWSEIWKSVPLIQESDDSVWIMPLPGKVDRISVATGQVAWSVQLDADRISYGGLTEDGKLIIRNQEGPGLWVFDSDSGELIWADPKAQVDSWWNLGTAILLGELSENDVHYRIMDMATGTQELRTGNFQRLSRLEDDRLLLASTHVLDLISTTDGSIIRSADLDSLVPKSSHVSTIGDCGPYFGLMVSMDYELDGDALTIFFDKETLIPVAQITLSKQYVPVTDLAIDKPIFFRQSGGEFIGAGVGIEG